VHTSQCYFVLLVSVHTSQCYLYSLCHCTLVNVILYSLCHLLSAFESLSVTSDIQFIVIAKFHIVAYMN